MEEISLEEHSAMTSFEYSAIKIDENLVINIEFEVEISFFSQHLLFYVILRQRTHSRESPVGDYCKIV